MSVARRGDGVEVDGPSHFVGRVPTGATALKRQSALIICNMSKLVDDARGGVRARRRAVELCWRRARGRAAR